jgi:hypothetical protein
MRSVRLIYFVSPFVLWLTILGTTGAQAADLQAANLCNFTPEQTAQAGCLCVMPNVRPAAYLDQITGDVVMTQAAGYSPIPTSPAGLVVGDRVLFSGSGQAVFSAPTCGATVVGPNTTLEIRQLKPGCACAALLNRHPVLAPILAGALIAGVLHIPEDHPVSP